MWCKRTTIILWRAILIPVDDSVSILFPGSLSRSQMRRGRVHNVLAGWKRIFSGL